MRCLFTRLILWPIQEDHTIKKVLCILEKTWFFGDVLSDFCVHQLRPKFMGVMLSSAKKGSSLDLYTNPGELCYLRLRKDPDLYTKAWNFKFFDQVNTGVLKDIHLNISRLWQRSLKCCHEQAWTTWLVEINSPSQPESIIPTRENQYMLPHMVCLVFRGLSTDDNAI